MAETGGERPSPSPAIVSLREIQCGLDHLSGGRGSGKRKRVGLIIGGQDTQSTLLY
jgi:hypothetical protein